MLIHGRCHCGNITLILQWTPKPTEIPARACSCSFCVKHGGVWTACPLGTLRIRTEDRAAVSMYSFGTRTADFHVCSRCGVTPVVTSRIDAQLYAVVNVKSLEGIDPSMLKHAVASFDDETESIRLARRKRNWIATVEYD
jgi:hypothetical protein